MSEDLLILPPRGVGGIALIGTAIDAAVDKLLDDAIARFPEAASERDLLRDELLYKIQEIGYIPESLDLFKKPEAESKHRSDPT